MRATATTAERPGVGTVPQATGISNGASRCRAVVDQRATCSTLVPLARIDLGNRGNFQPCEFG
jgi:hypothetical protein